MTSGRDALRGLLRPAGQARGALIAGRIEDKGRAIGRAVRIVEEGLRAALDEQRGGKLAADLKVLYGYVVVRLHRSQPGNDPPRWKSARLVAPCAPPGRAIGAARRRPDLLR